MMGHQLRGSAPDSWSHYPLGLGNGVQYVLKDRRTLILQIQMLVSSVETTGMAALLKGQSDCSITH